MFVRRSFLTGIVFFSLATPGGAEPCAPLQMFSNVVDFDRLPNGQIISIHDCDGDGFPDYRSIWTVVEFAEDPVACQDPYDSRQMIVPRSGYYRIEAEPVTILFLPEKKKGS
jgi:hypothetical protein